MILKTTLAELFVAYLIPFQKHNDVTSCIPVASTIKCANLFVLNVHAIHLMKNTQSSDCDHFILSYRFSKETLKMMVLWRLQYPLLSGSCSCKTT